MMWTICFTADDMDTFGNAASKSPHSPTLRMAGLLSALRKFCIERMCAPERYNTHSVTTSIARGALVGEDDETMKPLTYRRWLKDLRTESIVGWARVPAHTMVRPVV